MPKNSCPWMCSQQLARTSAHQGAQEGDHAQGAEARQLAQQHLEDCGSITGLRLRRLGGHLNMLARGCEHLLALMLLQHTQPPAALGLAGGCNACSSHAACGMTRDPPAKATKYTQGGGMLPLLAVACCGCCCGS